jgi:hypothetical protein
MLQGLAPSIPTEFNFGILRSFAFDVIAFEEQQLVEVLGVNFPPTTGFSTSANFIRDSDTNGNNNSNSNNNNNNNNILDSNSSNYNNSDKKCDSSLVSFPYSVNGHPDPWRYYESLAEEQEAKQRIPRHPKYRNSRWEASSRSTDPTVVLGTGRTGTGTGTLSLSQPLNVTGAVSLGHRAPMPLPERKYLDDSLSSTPTSSSSSIVRNSIIFPHTETLTCRDDNMSVSPPGECGFLDPDSAVSPVNVRVPMMATARTGRGGRERGRGGDFLLAKRQYAYISRSAKLERLTTIIRATNTPHGQCAPPFSSSSRRCLMGAFGNNNNYASTVHENDDVNEKKRVSVRREKTLLEKGKRKRKSLFLNPDLRAATLSEISSTSRVGA